MITHAAAGLPRIDPKTFRRLVLALLVATGTLTVVQAILGLGNR